MLLTLVELPKIMCIDAMKPGLNGDNDNKMDQRLIKMIWSMNGKNLAWNMPIYEKYHFQCQFK